MIRPQPFQEVMTNEQFVTCDSCSRIMYYVPPPPKPEAEAKKAKADSATPEQSEVAQPSEGDALTP
jgi:hypothetical protein